MDTTAPVDEYQLTFQTGGDTTIKTLNSTTTTVLLTDLKMGTVYTITVVATNTAGPGVPGQVVQATNIDRKLVGDWREGREEGKGGRECAWGGWLVRGD